MPEDTDIRWDGAVATVTFREVDVALEAEVTTISVRVTADVDAVCEQGDSMIQLHLSATALDTKDHPVSDDGTVEGAFTMPLKAKGSKAPGYTCQVTHASVTAVLEDFWTGATLVHTANYRPL